MLLKRIWKKLIVKYFRSKFSKVVSIVRDTGPINTTKNNVAGLAVISMVQKKDVDMYLVALKSFTRYLMPQKIVLVADPTIDEDDKKVLEYHVPGIEIIPVQNFRREYTPVGGCWERLNALSHYNADYYVIQLDADTVTHNCPEDVIEAVKKGCSFTLGTFQGQKLSGLKEAAEFANKHITSSDTHIQLLSESLLAQIADDLTELKHYVRGCAGFNGFPKGALDVALISKISDWFKEKTKGRWSEWGSEQFTCNLIVANIPGARILPVKRYLTPRKPEFSEVAFLHFIGSMRFTSSLYIKSVGIVIEELRAGHA